MTMAHSGLDETMDRQGMSWAEVDSQYKHKTENTEWLIKNILYDKSECNTSVFIVDLNGNTAKIHSLLVHFSFAMA